MKFILCMYTIPSEARALSREQLNEIESKHATFRTKYATEGTLLNGAGLMYRAASTYVGSPGYPINGVSSQDSPEITAYYVIECADTDRASEIAKELLDEHVISVEIRRIHHSNGMERE